MGKQNELPIIPCIPNEGCKYYPDCHLSTHHLAPKRLGETALQKQFIHHDRNKVRICRRLHDFYDMLTPSKLPSDERIQEFLDEQGNR